MKYEKGDFLVVPNKSQLKLLTAGSQALFMWICAYANEEGVCWPSRANLAKNLNCSDRTIDSYLKELEEKKFLKKEERIKDNEKQSNLYQVLIIGGGSEKSSPPSEKSALPPSEKSSHRTISNSLTKSITSEPEGSPFTVVLDEEEGKRKAPPKYPNAPAVLKLFKIIGNVPANWKINTAQLKACENLYKERGLEKIESALEFYSETRDQEYCPQITTPFDLDSKWTKLGQFKLKQ